VTEEERALMKEVTGAALSLAKRVAVLGWIVVAMFIYLLLFR
jgi:hypothetical protein